MVAHEGQGASSVRGARLERHAGQSAEHAVLGRVIVQVELVVHLSGEGQQPHLEKKKTRPAIFTSSSSTAAAAREPPPATVLSS